MFFISSKIKFFYLGCFVQLPQQYIHIYYLHKYYGNGEHFDCSFGIFSRIIFPRKNIKFTKTKLKAESNDKEKLRSSVRVSHTFSFQLVRSNFSFFIFFEFCFWRWSKITTFFNFLQIVRKIQLGLIFSKEFGIYQFVISTESTPRTHEIESTNIVFFSNPTNKSNYIHNLQ